jgi:hypothetical protein
MNQSAVSGLRVTINIWTKVHCRMWTFKEQPVAHGVEENLERRRLPKGYPMSLISSFHRDFRLRIYISKIISDCMKNIEVRSTWKHCLVNLLIFLMNISIRIIRVKKREEERPLSAEIISGRSADRCRMNVRLMSINSDGRIAHNKSEYFGLECGKKECEAWGRQVYLFNRSTGNPFLWRPSLFFTPESSTLFSNIYFKWTTFTCRWH